MAKYGTPPLFSPKIFFTKMTQNGLKWILNTTLKSMEFCRSDPPPGMENSILFFSFFLKASLIDCSSRFKASARPPEDRRLQAFSVVVAPHCLVVTEGLGSQAESWV